MSTDVNALLNSLFGGESPMAGILNFVPEPFHAALENIANPLGNIIQQQLHAPPPPSINTENIFHVIHENFHAVFQPPDVRDMPDFSHGFFGGFFPLLDFSNFLGMGHDSGDVLTGTLRQA